MAFFTFFAPGFSGKLFLANTDPEVRYTATFRNGLCLGVLKKLWRAVLREFDELKGIQWNWQSVDGAITKSTLGGKKTGKNPTDRGKLGIKRFVLTDARGVPLGVEVSGAKTHDVKLIEETIKSVQVQRPEPTTKRHQHDCLDQGCDSRDVRKLLKRRHCQRHIKSRGQEIKQRKSNKRFKPIRWIVERNSFVDQPLQTPACPLGKESQ